jgi:hypothetical protein
MIGVMTSRSSAVVQFVLPFEGLRDRVRNAAEANNVLMMRSALSTMKVDDISDVVIIRALKRCELLGRARKGQSRGEWQCVVSFNAKGFRAGGSVSLTISEGRVFVEDILWDYQP